MKTLLNTIIAVLLPASALADLNSGLVAHYTFDGNGNNSASSAYNLVEHAVAYQAGLFGQAAAFDGTNSYLQTPDLFPIVGTTSRSVDVWLNADSFWGYRNVLEWGDWSTPASAGTAWAIYLLPSQQGQPYASAHWVDFSTPSHPNSYGTGSWINLAVTYDGGSRTAAFYLNGNYIGGMLVLGDAANINTLIGPLTVGNVNTARVPYTDTWNAPWDGLMDDLRIYDRVLTATEVAQLSVVPEPSTLSLLLVAQGAAVALLRNRRIAVRRRA